VARRVPRGTVAQRVEPSEPRSVNTMRSIGKGKLAPGGARCLHSSLPMSRIGIGFALSLSVTTSLALAEPAASEARSGRETDVATDRGSPLPRYQLDARGAFGTGLSGFYALGQVGAAYRALPALLVGASIEHVFASNQGNDSCYEAGYSCPADFFAFGPRVELQPLPTWVVGPWIGAELGLMVFEGPHVSRVDFRSTALEGTLDVGLEVRPWSALAIGVYAAGKQCLTDPYSPAADQNETYLLSAGLRVAGRL
jgi:hypothetical protein